MLLRSVLVAALMLVPSGAPQATGGFHRSNDGPSPCSAAQLRTSTVNATLSIQTAGQSSPQFSAITVITVPAAWSSARALAADPFSSMFRNAIGCFLATSQTDYRPQPPSVSITDGNVIVRDKVDLSLDPLARGDVNVGLWVLHEDNRNVTVSLGNLPAGAVTAHWTITINTGTAVPRHWTSAPSNDDSRGKLSWKSIPLSSAQKLAVTLAWPAQFNFDHRISAWPGKLVAEAGWNLGAILFFFLAFLLLRKIRRSGLREPQAKPFLRAASRISLLGLASVAVCIIDQCEFDQPTYGWLDKPIKVLFYGGNPFSEADAFVNSEFFALISFAAILFYIAWRREYRKILILLATISLALIAAIIQLVPTIWGGDPSPIQDYGSGFVQLRGDPDSLAHVIIATLPLLITCFLLFSSIIGYVFGMWPVSMWPRSMRFKPRLLNGRPRVKHPPRVFLTALAFGLVTVGMVAYSSREDWGTNSVLGNNSDLGSLNWVATDLLWSFHWLILEVPGLLFWPVTASLFGALWFQSQEDNRIFFKNRRLSVAVLGLIYAGVVIGYWGEDFLFDIPIAFIAGYILLTRVAVGSRLEDLEKGIRFQGKVPADASGRKLKICQPVHLKAAETRRRLEAELAAMDRGDQAGPESDDIRTRREKLGLEILDTTKRWESNPVRPDPGQGLRKRFFRTSQRGERQDPGFTALAPENDSIDPGPVALAMGPEDSWWHNGWRCVYIGAPLTVLPTAYFLYENWLWPIDYRVGLIDNLQLVIATPIAWLAICFIYGCLQPYLRGESAPMRGATLGLVALISFTLDAIPTYLLHGPHYSHFLLDGLINIGFCVTLAILMDSAVLRRYHVKIGRLIDFYHISTIRVGAAYALTISIALIGVWQQVHVGNEVAQQQAQISTSIANQLRSQLTQPVGQP